MSERSSPDRDLKWLHDTAERVGKDHQNNNLNFTTKSREPKVRNEYGTKDQ